MSLIQRLGDPNDAGGKIVAVPQSFAFIDGIPIAVIGSAVDSHPPCPIPPTHCAGTVATGSAFAFINGVPITRMGDADTCGHTRAGGSPFAFING